MSHRRICQIACDGVRRTRIKQPAYSLPSLSDAPPDAAPPGKRLPVASIFSLCHSRHHHFTNFPCTGAIGNITYGGVLWANNVCFLFITFLFIISYKFFCHIKKICFFKKFTKNIQKTIYYFSAGYMNSGIRRGLPSVSTQAKTLLPSARITPVDFRLSV